jgi:nitroreductase
MTNDAELTKIERCLRVAARAPSPHNTQPWSPRIADGTVEVAVVPGRVLWAGDPSFRDLLLALGAWVESFAIAAAAEGCTAVVETLPHLELLDELPVDGPADPSRPVMVVRLADGAYETPFTADDVLDRRVHRGPLTSAPEIWAGMPGEPSWLRVQEIDAAAMRSLIRLGTAYTASRRSVARELVQWLRLDPDHPDYRRDGMTDAMLVVPPAVARLAAPFTRRASLREPALSVAGAVARKIEAVARRRGLPRATGPEAAGAGPAGPRHLALVADSRAIRTEAVDRALGMPRLDVIDAGRALQRLWLHAHREGIAVYPHSEVIDSPHAHTALRKRLGLQRAETALAVFSWGRPEGPVAHSPRLTDD